MLKTTPIFTLLTRCENWGGMGEIYIPIVADLPTTETPEYI